MPKLTAADIAEIEARNEKTAYWLQHEARARGERESMLCVALRGSADGITALLAHIREQDDQIEYRAKWLENSENRLAILQQTFIAHCAHREPVTNSGKIADCHAGIEGFSPFCVGMACPLLAGKDGE